MNHAAWGEAGIAGHHVTIGSTPEEFLAQAETVEALIAPTRGMKKLDLFAAPGTAVFAPLVASRSSTAQPSVAASSAARPASLATGRDRGWRPDAHAA